MDPGLRRDDGENVTFVSIAPITPAILIVIPAIPTVIPAKAKIQCFSLHIRWF